MSVSAVRSLRCPPAPAPPLLCPKVLSPRGCSSLLLCRPSCNPRVPPVRIADKSGCVAVVDTAAGSPKEMLARVKAHAEEVCRQILRSGGRPRALGSSFGEAGPSVSADAIVLAFNRLVAASSTGGSVTASRTPTATCLRMACPA